MSRTSVFHRATPGTETPKLDRTTTEWLRSQFPEASPRPVGPHGNTYPSEAEVWFEAGKRAAVRLLENALERQEKPGNVSQDAKA